MVLSIKWSTFTSSKFERTHLITIEQRLNSIKTVKSVKICSVTAKVNGQRLESCEHLKISHSTWLLGMMEVVTRPGTMFTPGHDGATMFTETWRHAPGHYSVQPSVTT